MPAKPAVANLNREEIAKREALLELQKRIRERKLFREYRHISAPGVIGAYPWQVQFHNAGKDNPERGLFAGNRVGKTSCAAAEVACHLTGEYPKWWEGKRFDEAVRFWCGGETNETVRDVIQKHLLGEQGEHGTGWIPADRLIGKPKYRQAGVSEVVDVFYVQHKSGGISYCSLKTYEQGVEKWRGARLHGVWLDEEPGMQLYVEAMTRVLDHKGIVLCTFTPHKGQTEVVSHFLDAKPGAGIYCQTVTWDDAPHLDPAEKERLWNSYPPHERETRAKGIPMMGAGAVFPISDDTITCEPFPIPEHWWRINGVDFGINHPAAGAFCAVDRDSDTFYVYDCYKAANETPIYHAAAMKKHGDWIPTAWPHDGLQRDKGSGEVLKDLYRQHQLYMLPEPAKYKDERGNSVEPALYEMYEYMRTGRFKVFKNLGAWMEEKRRYHRAEDGKLVKTNDDIISATRYAFVVRGRARQKPTGVVRNTGPKASIIR